MTLLYETKVHSSDLHVVNSNIVQDVEGNDCNQISLSLLPSLVTDQPEPSQSPTVLSGAAKTDALPDYYYCYDRSFTIGRALGA